MSHQTALDALGKMTRVLKAFEDAEVVLKALAGLEQNEKELRTAADAARADAEAARAELADAKETLAAAKKATVKVKDDAVAKAAQVVAEAESKASEINDRIVAAQRHAAGELTDTLAAVEQARADCDKATTDLAYLETKIAEARAHIAKMMG
jgi:DNA repair exonuclease SbcCD ATPase subunit